jgi:Flp pilus assembly pilin Flp
VWRALKRLLSDEQGDTVVEYALLTAGVGLAGIATWPVLAAEIGHQYQNLDANTQELWEVPDPGAGS